MNWSKVRLGLKKQAPEVFRMERVSALIDVYSFGICLWEIWYPGKRVCVSVAPQLQLIQPHTFSLRICTRPILTL
jgi:hypothetical protein